MASMFESTSIKSIDLSNFDTSKVTNISYMFGGCSNLVSIDVSNFTTSQVKSMKGMFYKISSKTVTLNLTDFYTSKVLICLVCSQIV